jgi:hypothetical protein
MNAVFLHNGIIRMPLFLGFFAHAYHIRAISLLYLLPYDCLNRIGKLAFRYLMLRHYLRVGVSYSDMDALRDLKIEGDSPISAFNGR